MDIQVFQIPLNSWNFLTKLETVCVVRRGVIELIMNWMQTSKLKSPAAAGLITNIVAENKH